MNSPEYEKICLKDKDYSGFSEKQLDINMETGVFSKKGNVKKTIFQKKKRTLFQKKLKK
jgi:hypothetical protein